MEIDAIYDRFYEVTSIVGFKFENDTLQFLVDWDGVS